MYGWAASRPVKTMRHTTIWLLGCCLAACGDSGGRDAGNSAGTAVTGVTGVTGVTVGSPSTGDETTEPTTSGEPSTTGASASTSASASATEPPGGTSNGSDCSGDDDCPPGERCTPFTQVCTVPDGCVLSEDCEDGFVCGAGGACEIGGCDADAFNLTVVPPNVLIVLDRSGSMGGDVQDTNKNRWEVAKDAINNLVNTFNAEIRFGLNTYSSCIAGQQCTAGSIVVPIGNLNAGPITGFLANKGNGYLCNSGMPETSTGNTLDALVGEPTLQDPARTNAVLLITDGNENSECKTSTEGKLAAAKLLAQAIPVKTFAVGFSDGIIGSLAEIAAAGGTEEPYNANNPASLEAALTAIAGAVASCQFLLDSVPADPSKIYVFFDKDPAGIPQDPQNGWTYDPDTNTITFHGTACEAIKNGTIVDIDVIFGCNVPPPG